MTAWLEHVHSYWLAGGWLLAPLALVSVGIWGLGLRSGFAIGRVGDETRRLYRDLEAEAPSAADVLERHSGGVAEAFRRGVREIRAGGRPLHTLERVEAECTGPLRKDVGVLEALTAAAPLLGLLGTVSGMIQTFDAVSAVAVDTGSRVAGGISSALITTQFGLVIAVPGVFGSAHLRRKLREVETSLARCRFLLLENGRPE